MGRKAGGLYMNPKSLGSLHKPCTKEMITFLNCLALCQNNDETCACQKELLSTCMNAQALLTLLQSGSVSKPLKRLGDDGKLDEGQV